VLKRELLVRFISYLGLRVLRGKFVTMSRAYGNMQKYFLVSAKHQSVGDSRFNNVYFVFSDDYFKQPC